MQLLRETPKRNYQRLNVKTILDLFQDAERKQDSECPKLDTQFKQCDKENRIPSKEVSYGDDSKPMN